MRDRGQLPTPSREASQSREIAPRPVTDIAPETVADIDQATKKIVEWGVKLPANNRLSQARKVLSHAANTGEIVPAQRGDDLGLRSLELAFDYGAIADTLPANRVADVRKDLEKSLEGDLSPPEALMGPLQLQAQLVVRAALVRAGLSPEHPTKSPRKGVRPDLILRRNDVSYGVEVKRPKSEAGLLSRLDHGRDQLVGYGVRGAVLVDVTDCVRGVRREEIDQEVRRLALRLYGRAFVTGKGYKPGYENVMVAGTFARVGWHSNDQADHSIVAVHTSSVIGVFAQEDGSVLDLDARWIRTNFVDGLGIMYQTLAEVHGQGK